MKTLRATQADITANARVKLYPNSATLQVSNASIFREPGWEPCKRLYDVPPKGKGKDPERSLEVSRARARAAVRDIALCNQFEYFFTWTLDPAKINRYAAEEVLKVIQNFLKHMVSRKNFAYVIVAELHKDGAIHFHGLCKLGDLRIEPAVNPYTGEVLETERGQIIYNMPDWKLGYSTCIPIDENYERTCNYIAKYLTKDAVKATHKIFGKWYFSSRNLVKKPDIYLVHDVTYDEFMQENPDCVPVDLFLDVKLASKSIGGAGA